MLIVSALNGLYYQQPKETITINNKSDMAEKKSTKRKQVKNKSVEKSFFSVKTLETAGFILGLFLSVAALFILLSLLSFFATGNLDQTALEQQSAENVHNLGGMIGASTANYLINHCFGIFSFIIPIFMIQLGLKLMGVTKRRIFPQFIHEMMIMIWGSVFFATILSNGSFRWGGGHGDFVSQWLVKSLGNFGAIALLLLIAICYLIFVSKKTIEYIQKGFEKTATATEKISSMISSTSAKKDNNSEEANGQSNGKRTVSVVPPMDQVTSRTLFEEKDEEDNEPDTEVVINIDNKENENATVINIPIETIEPSKPQNNGTTPESMEISSGGDDEEASGKTVEQILAEQGPYDPRKSLENYKFPTLDLLKKYGNDNTEIDEAEQKANADRIIEVLGNFDVRITKITATVGPTVTLYEITPAPGVRISKIRNLENDIALSLSALGIRIIAPIPGKGTIGIEVPNKNPKIVSMESVLNSRKFEETKYELPVAIGKTITNEVCIFDLAKMPHLLVAGATGQGKSVGLNALISSLLYKKHPAELKFVMIDPKKVEFSMYASLEKYFMAMLPDQDDPIIYDDGNKVVNTLQSLCQLMDARYDLLKKAKLRTIQEYNEKFKKRLLSPKEGHEFMPYIVIIIDEFGDLIMTAGKQVELPIARIAQKARAVGMHMVIATQRPTTNIITGTIKANFPARMAFRVVSQIDSRTIIETTGANQLIGKGDMLILSSSTGAEPLRVQCAFIDTPEVERVCEFIENQSGYIPPYLLPEPIVEGDKGGEGVQMLDQLDSMFDEVARMIVATQQGSTSKIQRHFSIGYNRAGRLMDQMEKAGIVSEARGSKPRDVLISDLAQLEAKLAEVHGK